MIADRCFVISFFVYCVLLDGGGRILDVIDGNFFFYNLFICGEGSQILCFELVIITYIYEYVAVL